MFCLDWVSHLSRRCCSQWRNSSNLTAKYSHKILDIDKPRSGTYVRVYSIYICYDKCRRMRKCVFEMRPAQKWTAHKDKSLSWAELNHANLWQESHPPGAGSVELCSWLIRNSVSRRSRSGGSERGREEPTQKAKTENSKPQVNAKAQWRHLAACSRSRESVDTFEYRRKIDKNVYDNIFIDSEGGVEVQWARFELLSVYFDNSKLRSTRDLKCCIDIVRGSVHSSRCIEPPRFVSIQRTIDLSFLASSSTKHN